MFKLFKIILQRKTLLYQSLFGEGDDIHPILSQNQSFDYRLYSDKYHKTTGEVKIITKSQVQDSMYNSRHYKLNPKIKFYSKCIYLDASFEIINPEFISFLTNELKNSLFVFFKHPWRDCIYDEVLECNKITKYDLGKLNGRSEYYKSINYPKHFGLYCGGCFAYKNIPLVKRIQNEWWEETVKCGMMDQVALPYILWKNNIPKELIKIIDLDIYNNNYIKYFPHKKQYVFKNNY